MLLSEIGYKVDTPATGYRANHYYPIIGQALRLIPIGPFPRLVANGAQSGLLLRGSNKTWLRKIF